MSVSRLQQDQYFPMLGPFFVDAVHCLLSFATNAKDLVAIAAVDHVAELGCVFVMFVPPPLRSEL